MIDLIFLISPHSLQEIIHSRKQQVCVCQVWWMMIDWFDLPNLTTFTTGRYSFYSTTSLSLNSIMMIGWLIWSSSTHYIHYRKGFILFNNKFEFVKYDEWWLIDLIFLNSLHLLQEIIHSIQQQVWVWIVWWYMIDWLIWSS